jgi:hypothetical protein
MEVHPQNSSYSSLDFYPHITENSPEKIISLTISFFGIIFGPPILLSIIWFEKYGSDKKQTLINIIFAYCCWTSLKYIFLVEIFDVLLYFWTIASYYLLSKGDYKKFSWLHNWHVHICSHGHEICLHILA